MPIQLQVTINDFKKVLSFLKEKNIQLKVRTHSGWTNNYLHIVSFITNADAKINSRTESHANVKGVVLSNSKETEGILINNISTVTAFELQEPCETFQAKTIYKLKDGEIILNNIN